MSNDQIEYRALSGGDRAAVALAAISHLSKSDQEVMWLKVLNWEDEEVAEIAGLPACDVTQSWDRGCRYLRAWMSNTGRGIAIASVDQRSNQKDSDIFGLFLLAETALADLDVVDIRTTSASEVGIAVSPDDLNWSEKAPMDDATRKPMRLHRPRQRRRPEGRLQNRRTRAFRSAAAPLGVAVAVVLAALLFLFVGALKDRSTVDERNASPGVSAVVTAPSTAGPFVQFTSPVDDDAVVSPLAVRGEAVLAGGNLWLLLKGLNEDPLYYVTTDQPITVGADGTWSSALHLGRGACDLGKQYTLIAVESPINGTIEKSLPLRPAGEYSVRLDDVPADIRVLATIDIELGSYTGDRSC